jgi:hypothetical protein
MQLVFLKIPNIRYHINREYASVAAASSGDRDIFSATSAMRPRDAARPGAVSFILLRFGRKKQLPMKG